MAAQNETIANGITAQSNTYPENSAASGITSRVKDYTSTAMGNIQNAGNKAARSSKSMLDRNFPPERRNALSERIQDFMLAHPKLSGFLAMNLVMSVIPLALFLLFSITVFLSALTVGILLGVLGAVFFTLFMVGCALFLVVPIVLFTTTTACFLFTWGLGSYYILKWANGEFGTNSAPEGQTIDEKLNRLTGGRLGALLDSARPRSHNRTTRPVGDGSGQMKEIKAEANGDDQGS